MTSEKIAAEKEAVLNQLFELAELLNTQQETLKDVIRKLADANERLPASEFARLFRVTAESLGLGPEA